MKVETRYAYGEKLWLMHANCPEEGKVVGITCVCAKDPSGKISQQVTYNVRPLRGGDGIEVAQSDAFPTRERLLDHVFGTNTTVVLLSLQNHGFATEYETRFNVGDRVWMMLGNKPAEREIKSIRYTCLEDANFNKMEKVAYELTTENSDKTDFVEAYDEKPNAPKRQILFPTKAELRKSLEEL